VTSNLTSNRLTCKEAVELVTDYLEEALLPQMEARFNRHLDTCPGCTIYVDQMRQTLHTLRWLAAEATSGEEQQELLQVFRNWQSHQPGGQPHEVIE
jgi:predicted anti-sigma-YlaC factor YlaD